MGFFRVSFTRWCPPSYVCWFIIPITSSIFHPHSSTQTWVIVLIWSYLHQLNAWTRTGAPPHVGFLYSWWCWWWWSRGSRGSDHPLASSMAMALNSSHSSVLSKRIQGHGGKHGETHGHGGLLLWNIPEICWELLGYLYFSETISNGVDKISPRISSVFPLWIIFFVMQFLGMARCVLWLVDSQ